MNKINIITRTSKEHEQVLGKALLKENFETEYFNLAGFAYDNGKLFHNGLSLPNDGVFLWKISDSVFPSVEHLYKALNTNYKILNSFDAVKLTNSKYEKHEHLKKFNIPNLYTVPVFPGNPVPSGWTAMLNFSGHVEEHIIGDSNTVIDFNTSRQWVMRPVIDKRTNYVVNIFDGEILYCEQISEDDVVAPDVEVSSEIAEVALKTAEALGLKICSITVDEKYYTVIDVKTDVQNVEKCLNSFAQKMGLTVNQNH